MPVSTIVPGVHQISLGFVNVFLLEGEQGLTLVDTGIPGSEAKILAALAALNRQPKDICSIVITHLHADHTGSLVKLKAITGAKVYAHTAEAEAIRAGRSMRTMQPAPGWFNELVVRLAVRKPSVLAPVSVEHALQDGDEVPGGFRVMHTPGHTVGHLVLWSSRQGGVFILGDAASHMLRLGYSFIYEDFEQGRRSLQQIARQDFEVACFSHGNAIVGGAAGQFKQQWS